MLIVEKLPWAQHARGDPRRRGGAGGAAARPAGHRRSTPRSSGPATFIEMAIEQPDQRAAARVACSSSSCSALFLFEWRVALISLVTIPLSLVAAGLVLYLRGTTINTMVLAGFVIALGAIVDDAIIDIENIVRRLRQHREAGSGRVDRQRSSSRPRSRSAAPIVYATLITSSRCMPVFFLDGPHRRVLPAARALVRAGGAGVDARRADGHAGAEPDPAARRAARAPRAAARPVAEGAATRGASAGSSGRPRRAYATVAADRRSAGR